MTFARKKIDVEFEMASGQFSAGGGNNAKITGRRVIAQIQVTASAMGVAEIAIYGMPLSQMNQLSTVGKQFHLVMKNKVTISVAEGDAPMQKLFTGTIGSAFVDGQSQPQVCFRVSAISGLISKIKPVEPTTKKGESDVSQLFKDIAKKAEMEFEGSGLDGLKIANPYFPGTALMQAASLARAMGLSWAPDKGKLAVWKPGQSRDGDSAKISRDTGMVGYPAFNQNNVIVTTSFNGALEIGRKINVESDLKPACGEWSIHAINHALSSETPNGPWFSIIQANTIGDTPA